MVFGRERGQVGVFEHGHAASGRLRAGNDNPRVGTQQVGIEQPNSQFMMTDERSLRCLDARRGNLALFEGNQPSIEQQEIDRPTSFDQLSNRGPGAGGRVQIKLQRSEHPFFGFRREPLGRFLGLGQAATRYRDLLPSPVGEQAGCGITEPRRGAGDESD